MLEFIYAWWYDEDEEMDILYLNEKSYFEETGYLMDGFDGDELYDATEPIIERLGLFELSECNYEITTSKEQVTRELDALPNFSFSQEFQDLLDQE